ncbi:7-cyano-7-deazaguanine synthase [Niastella populi]|uniref:7-cyano-7-deazaguanine synthase n=1 Tax=Niastella populi TaxID=550983 RepID=A0A1V9G6G7_9BACT|nr:7-cyano-7-deazaguanine synthase [Niastella populi]OQP66239.1 hypothetical protein A4R26_33515 [Niastella populi]
MKNAVVIFSGGVDSTAATLWTLEQGYDDVELLTYRFADERRQYGELKGAMTVASHLNLNHTIIDHQIPYPAYPLTNQPFCQHIERKELPNDVALYGVFPFNVALLLIFGASYAALRNATDIIFGAIADEAHISPDFRTEYTELITQLLNKSKTVTKKEMKVITPLVNKHKWEIMETYKGKEDLFHKTWSCKYSNDSTHCGECYGCEGRRLGALLAGLDDKTAYKKNEIEFPFSDFELNTMKNKETRSSLLSNIDFLSKISLYSHGSGKG